MKANQILVLKIDGMHCASCVRRVSAALSQVPGVELERVEVGSAELRYSEAAASQQEIAQKINELGFQVV